MKLTTAQQRMLAEVAQAGPAGRTYNGRARRTIKALEAAGRVVVHWGGHLQPKGGGIRIVDRITVRLPEHAERKD